MKVTDIKTNQDLRNFLKTFYETHATALNGIMEKLPEAVRGELKAMRDSISESLRALPPLDQVPAAQDAAWAFNAFGDAITRISEYSNSLLERLENLKKEIDAKALALNSLQEQVTKGELLGKDRVKELCDLARAEGSSAAQPAIIAARKTALELAGLPVPVDDVLGLPLEQYTARFETAKANIKTLAEKGLKIGGKGEAMVKQTAWLGATEFNGQMSMLADFLPSTTSTKADPLLGNGGQPQTTKESESKATPAIALC